MTRTAFLFIRERHQARKIFHFSALCGIRFTSLFFFLIIFRKNIFPFNVVKLNHLPTKLNFADQFGHLTKRVVFFLYLVFVLKIN